MKKIINYSYELFEEQMVKTLKLVNHLNPDMIFAPSRGGLIYGVRLSHLTNLPLGLIESSRIDFVKETKILSEIPEEVKTIVLVDEILDTGETTHCILDQLFKIREDLKIHVIPLVTINKTFEYKNQKIQDGFSNVTIFDLQAFDIPDDNCWINFWWENPNICMDCNQGETCFKDERDIHCNIKNKSFPSNWGCEKFEKKT